MNVRRDNEPRREGAMRYKESTMSRNPEEEIVWRDDWMSIENVRRSKVHAILAQNSGHLLKSVAKVEIGSSSGVT